MSFQRQLPHPQNEIPDHVQNTKNLNQTVLNKVLRLIWLHDTLRRLYEAVNMQLCGTYMVIIIQQLTWKLVSFAWRYTPYWRFNSGFQVSKSRLQTGEHNSQMSYSVVDTIAFIHQSYYISAHALGMITSWESISWSNNYLASGH